MKKVIFMMICWVIYTAAFGQDAKQLQEEGIEKAEAGELDEAMVLFSRSIELEPDDHYAWFNRGITQNMLGLNRGALLDFEQTIKLDPYYAKGYLNRGTTKKRLTDYEGAISDYSYAITLEPEYADAFYNRGLVLEMLSKNDSACLDFTRALELGLEGAQRKVDNCSDTTKSDQVVHPILRLTESADNRKYGYTADLPIKAGLGPDGGPANQRAYLNLLRDAQGRSIAYNRLGSCCAYASDNALFGMALLDKYEITYLDKKGKEKKAILYISMYDYEAPLIVSGFSTVGQK